MVRHASHAHEAGGDALSARESLRWVHGDASALDATLRVAVVGSRSPPQAALDWAYAHARDLARAGVCVVSGLARGVDAAAHRGALDGGGQTVAVLPHGVDPQRLTDVYPPEHRSLAQDIVARGGALASAWPPGTSPAGWRFVARDRQQVALSHAVVAVWSEPDSGTMHTVRAALRSGVPLGVPAPPAEVGLGLAPLRARATPVERVEDVLGLLARGGPGPLWS